jgi:hypothetical protein
MVLAAANKARQFLHVSYIQCVRVEEVRRAREDVAVLLGDLPTGFRMLTDFSQLEAMDLDCTEEIGKIMDLCRKKKVGRVVRVVPDPSKDIGLSIISHFHSGHQVHAQVCKTLVEAAKLLSI